MTTTVADIGEKALIHDLIKPLLNPGRNPLLAGDDCGGFVVDGDATVLVSTDRVPWDLVSFELGLIDIEQLGYYLAVLNLSDVAAMGGTVRGLVLTLALPSSFLVSDLERLLRGVARACAEHGCDILGGDLSDAREPSLSATVLGVAGLQGGLRRSGVTAGHVPYCTSIVGLTPTAFAYFREAKPRGLKLSSAAEELLVEQFSRPVPRLELGRRLAAAATTITCMDNTDGLAQSLREISQAGDVGFVLDRALLPVHEVTSAVASFLGLDPVLLALRPGADFQLVGSYAGPEIPDGAVIPLGSVAGPPGAVALRDAHGLVEPLHVEGWDYYGRTGDRAEWS